MNNLIDIINDRFEYKQDGFYIKKSYSSRAIIGKRAGYEANGYREININRKRYKEHHLVWFYHTGQLPNMFIDHIDRNKQNNDFNNLRLASNQENCCNKNVYKNSSTKHRGISFIQKRNAFYAQIQVKGKKYNLGYYNSLPDAIKARKNAEIKYFGAFAPL